MSQIMDDLREKTRLTERRMIAKNMIKRGRDSLEEISELTDLPIAEIEKLARGESA